MSLNVDARMLTPGKTQEGSEGKNGEPPHEGTGPQGSELCGGFYHSLDWFQENPNRKPWILPVSMEFSCRFPNKTNPMNHTASF